MSFFIIIILMFTELMLRLPIDVINCSSFTHTVRKLPPTFIQTLHTCNEFKQTWLKYASLWSIL